MSTSRPYLYVTFIILGLAGCGDKRVDTATGGATETGTSSPGSSSSSASVPTTSTDPGTTAGTSSSASGTTTTTTTTPTSGNIISESGTDSTTTTGGESTGECVQMPLPDTSTTDGTSTTNGGPCNDEPGQPINSPCTDATGCGCDTGKCFIVPALGGFCGECLDDDDCPGGCTIPNPIAGVGATCNSGGPGEGCNTDAACLNTCAPTCGTMLEVPGIIKVSTCGQCATDADCTSAARPNCTPEYDIPNFSGQLACKADGSVPNDGGCSLAGGGDAVCQSGHCGEASVMGLLKLGICGECNADTDCPNGQLCTDPAVDLDSGTLIGATCM